jgi:AcrR family transcriptional regulator
VARASFIRESADVRRQSLIDAAAQCLAERGAAGASVRVVCTRAGVSAGLLAHYFSGIDALILATYHETARRVAEAAEVAAAAAGPDPRARLDAYVLATFRPPVLDPELLATWVAFWGMKKSNPAMVAAHAETYADYRQSMEALVAPCAPHLTATELRMAAIGITALLDGLWLELCLDPRTFSPADAESITLRWLETLLASPA